jgi:hypothetical protein
VVEMINACDAPSKRRLRARVQKPKKVHAEMSEVYQRSKGGDAQIPLK